MGLATSLIDTFSSILDSIGGALKMNLADYCDLETIDDENTLVSRQGYLCSVLEIHGSQRLRSGNGVTELVNTLKRSIQSEFDKPGRAIQMYFEVDHDRTREQIQASQLGARRTAQRLDLNMPDLFDERENYLSQWVSFERCFMVVWTTDGTLSKSDRKEEAKSRQQIMKGKVITRNSQNPLAATGSLRSSHSAFVETMMRELKTVKVISKLLNSKKALQEIRRSIDPGWTANDWKPSVPGDVVRPSVRSQDVANEEWEVLWPRLGWQLCPRDAEIVGKNEVNIGDRVYVPLYIDQFQKDESRFAALFGKTIDTKNQLPWRISFLIESSGLSNFAFKGMAASLMGLAGAGNKAIDSSMKWLRHQQNVVKEPIVQIRCCVTTWAPLGQNALARKRASMLGQILGSWGGCEVSEVTGDPVAGVISASLGMTLNSIGTRSAAPLSEALPMLPFTRPSSPWPEGSVLFRSPDGKIMPFEPYSSMQSRWITLIFAAPGSGKSVLMNSLNLALTLAAQNQKLPRIAIIDIGPSSGGLISLLQSALPPERRHEVVHKRLRMVDSDAINVFDTLLCCRFPTSPHQQFLRNFVTLLMTEPGQKVPPSGMQSIVTQVLDELYVRFSDKNFPKPYVVGQDDRVDDAIRRHRLQVDKSTTWWEVVDLLFLKEEYYVAKRAQRYAVPLLMDAVTVVQDTKVRENLGKIISESTGELLIDTFSRQIGTLLSIFPIMAIPTAFDLGEARVTALDLDEVAKSGGPQADWQTGILYMLARHVMAQDFYIKDELIPDMPAPAKFALPHTVPREKIQQYHGARIEELMATPKRLCYDEFHRTSQCLPVQEQVVTDMREGRKFQVDIMLASQSIVDFNAQMREFASSIYVLDKGSAEMTEKIATTFGFDTDEERSAIETQIRPPQAGGGIFLAQHQTKENTFTMLLANTLGPIELWAFSTTAEDVYIRRKCYEALGPTLARKALATRFPGGGAQRQIEIIREEQKERGVFSDENLLDVIAGEVIHLGRQIQDELMHSS